jgi:hypothetical protein
MSALVGPWVVYLMTVSKHPDGMRAVCEQVEWDQMQLARPGYHKLIQDGILSEQDAELLARGNLGDRRVRLGKSR